MNNYFDLKPLEIKYYFLALLIALPFILIYALLELFIRVYFKYGEIDTSFILPFIVMLMVFYLIFILASIGSPRIRRYRIEGNRIIVSSILSKQIMIPFTDIKIIDYISSKKLGDSDIITLYAKDDNKLFSLTKDDYLPENIIKFIELLKDQNVEITDNIKKFIEENYRDIKRNNLSL